MRPKTSLTCVGFSSKVKIERGVLREESEELGQGTVEVAGSLFFVPGVSRIVLSETEAYVKHFARVGLRKLRTFECWKLLTRADGIVEINDVVCPCPGGSAQFQLFESVYPEGSIFHKQSKKR